MMISVNILLHGGNGFGLPENILMSVLARMAGRWQAVRPNVSLTPSDDVIGLAI